MNKKLSVLFLLLGLVFVSFLFSINALAIKNDTSYKDEQIISESDSLDEAYLTYATEDDISYKDGQIISESDSLDEAYLTYATEDDISVLRDNTDNSVNPLADELIKPKTITVFYVNYASIPEFYSYSEFTGGYWFRGILLLTQVVKVSNGWNATFSGRLSAFTD